MNSVLIVYLQYPASLFCKNRRASRYPCWHIDLSTRGSGGNKARDRRYKFDNETCILVPLAQN